MLSKSRVLSVILLVIVFSHVALVESQDVRCGIVFRSEGDADGVRLKVYAQHDGSFMLKSTLHIPRSGILPGMELAPDREHLYLAWLVEYDSWLEIVDLSTFEPTTVTEIQLEAGSFIASPRRKAWSPDSEKILLHNTFDNYNNRLFVYDLTRKRFYFPTELTEVFAPLWSPNSDWIAFVAYDFQMIGGGWRIPRDYALYVTEFDGTPIKTIAIAQDQPARFQWLSDTELAVTTCSNDECELAIHELVNGDVTNIQLGTYLVSSYLSSTDRFLLTSLDYSGVYFEERKTGDVTTFSQGHRLLSEPQVSNDERFLSFTADLNGIYSLVIGDTQDQIVKAVIVLDADRPEILTNNAYDVLSVMRGFYFKFGAWHPEENAFLFADNGAIYVYDVTSDTSEMIVSPSSPERSWGPQWVCSG